MARIWFIGLEQRIQGKLLIAEAKNKDRLYEKLLQEAYDGERGRVFDEMEVNFEQRDRLIASGKERDEAEEFVANANISLLYKDWKFVESEEIPIAEISAFANKAWGNPPKNDA